MGRVRFPIFVDTMYCAGHACSAVHTMETFEESVTSSNVAKVCIVRLPARPKQSNVGHDDLGYNLQQLFDTEVHPGHIPGTHNTIQSGRRHHTTSVMIRTCPATILHE